MADIHIHRTHRLGLAKARKTAWAWAEAVEKKFDMECTVIEGETSDVVEFTRPGVTGRLVVEADAFDLTAKLGFLVGVFSARIEQEIEANLDQLFAAAEKKPAAKKNAAKKKASP
ncbi:MAG: polyhydroxyalkanoic acid system family protein [Caldimonas sp.]